MKHIITFCLLLCSTALFAQKNTIGFFVSPDYAYRHYELTDNNRQAELWLDNTYQKAKPGYTIGISYEREIIKIFTINTGINFSNKGYQYYFDADKLKFSDQIVAKRGFVPPQGPNNVDYHAIRQRINFFQLCVPVSATYKFPLRHFTLFINAGISVNYTVDANYAFIKYKNSGKNEKTHQNQNDLYDRWSQFFIASVGIEKEFKGYKFRIFPNLNYTINNYYTFHYFLKVYPYSIGLGLGAYKSF